jgi:hypothetical protein
MGMEAQALIVIIKWDTVKSEGTCVSTITAWSSMRRVCATVRSVRSKIKRHAKAWISYSECYSQ